MKPPVGRLQALLVFSLLVIPPAAAGELRVRGTIFCDPGGGVSDSAAAPNLFLVASPSLDASKAVVQSPDGSFEFRLSRNFLDRGLTLSIYRGSQLVSTSREFLEPGRAHPVGSGASRYVLGPHRIDLDCELLRADPDSAQGILQVLTVPDSTGLPPSGSSWPGWPWCGPWCIDCCDFWRGLILLLMLPNSPSALTAILERPPDILSRDTLMVIDSTMPDFPATESLPYYRQVHSEAPGRSLLSLRFPAEAAFNNPSAAVFSGTSVWGIDNASHQWLRGSGAMPVKIGHSPEGPPRGFLTLGVLARLEDRDVRATLSERPPVAVSTPYAEWAITAGLAGRMNQRVSLGVSLLRIEQRIGGLDAVERRGERRGDADVDTVYAAISKIGTGGSWDMNLGTTWLVNDRIRVAAAVFHLFDESPSNVGPAPRSMREWVAAVQWSPRRLEAGLEVSFLDEAVDLTLGAGYRFTDDIAVDAAYASRYRAVSLSTVLGTRPLGLRLAVSRDDPFDWSFQTGLVWYGG